MADLINDIGIATWAGKYLMGATWAAANAHQRGQSVNGAEGVWRTFAWRVSPFDSPEVALQLEYALALHSRSILESGGFPSTALPPAVSEVVQPFTRGRIVPLASSSRDPAAAGVAYEELDRRYVGRQSASRNQVIVETWRTLDGSGRNAEAQYYFAGQAENRLQYVPDTTAPARAPAWGNKLLLPTTANGFAQFFIREETETERRAHILPLQWLRVGQHVGLPGKVLNTEAPAAAIRLPGWDLGGQLFFQLSWDASLQRADYLMATNEVRAGRARHYHVSIRLYEWGSF